MRILIINDRRAEREAMIRALPAESCRVEAVGDEAAALLAIMRESPQVIVFAVPNKGGSDLVTRLKGADSSGQAYLVAVFEAAVSGKELTRLMAAGVHDFVRRPIVDGEFLERVKAPARLLQWARSLAKPAEFDLSVAPDVSALRAWQELGLLVAEDLSEIAGQPFSVREGWPKRFTRGVQSATIPMSLAGDQLEVRVSIAVDALTLVWLRQALLGDPAANDAATDDCLRELANTAGGAVKRAALCESVILTTGLPRNERSSNFPGQCRCWTLALAEGDACIAVVGEIRRRENRRVAASELCEGMVVAHDVRNEGGILLVPIGSRLTSTTASRLAKLLGPRFLLEVAPAA